MDKIINIPKGNKFYHGGFMHKIIPEGEVGKFKIVYNIATEEDVRFMKVKTIFNPHRYKEYFDFIPGTYTKLVWDNKEIVMSDTPMEIRTNSEFINNANGSVLIGGLGLGIILLSIQNNEKVTSITVVEKNKEVIDLILKHLPLNNKIKIEVEDIFKWKTKSKFDCIYFDIWNNISGDNYPEMNKLHRKFCKKVNRSNPDYWIDSWRKKDCKKLNKEY